MKYSVRAELHCHSIFDGQLVSYFPFIYDSVQTVEEIIAFSLKNKIKILSVTDHNSLNGSLKAQEIITKKRLDIILVPGCEINAREGHILAYNIKKEIPKHLSSKETIDRIHKQGGIAVAAHPYSPVGVRKYIKRLNFDAVEGYNSLIPAKINKMAVKVANKINIPIIAGSDSHQIDVLGNGLTIFPEYANTKEKIIECIKKGDFTIDFKQAKMLKISLSFFRKNLSLIRKRLLGSEFS